MPKFPDKVARLEEGWAVRYNGCIEVARWNSKGAAEAHLTGLQMGRVKPHPETLPPNKFNGSLFGP